MQARGDVFEYADNLLEKWYPTLEQGDKKGVVVLITTAKEGAVAGGPAFNAAVGDTILESIATESLPSECRHDWDFIRSTTSKKPETKRNSLMDGSHCWR